MAFRFSLVPPSSLLELFERVRELLPQIGPASTIIPNVEVGIEETAIAHGLGSAPSMVRTSTPHCLAIVGQTRQADIKCIYLHASNLCVVDVEVLP